jgi:hypothetical protein
MKMQILGDAASVYEEPDADSPLVATLEKETLFDSGDVEKKGDSSWVSVVLPDGTHGYIDGETRIRGIRKFTLRQSADVHETWSDASPVTKSLQPGEVLLVGRTVPHDGKEWAEVFDAGCRPIGFTGPVYHAEQCDDVTTILRADQPPPSAAKSVADALRQEKWEVDSQGPGEIQAHASPGPFNATNAGNVLLGLLRFCFWPLIYGGNPQATIFPTEFMPRLGVAISVRPKGRGSVVVINATPISFLGSPMSHSCTSRLVNGIRARLRAGGEAPSAPPPPRDEGAVSRPNQQAAAAQPAPIRFACPRCGKQLKAPVKASGRTTCCPGCGVGLTVPQP